MRRKMKHGMAGTPLYKAWENMRQRTTNRRTYPTYAGVDCDPRWCTFEGFLANPPSASELFAPGMCLARIGDVGDYSPENTRWLTRADNTREQKRPPPKTHCVHGHEYTAENTLTDTNGTRRCRTCARSRKRAWRQAHG